MTLVSMIRLGKGAGIAYADSEVTYAGNHEERTYQMHGRKLRRLGTSNSFAGVAGHAEFGRQIMDLAYTQAKKAGLAFEHPEKLKDVLLGAYVSVRRELIKNLELDPIGASWEDYRKGRLSKKIMEKIDGVLREPALLDVTLVFGGAQRPVAGKKGKFDFDIIDDEFYLYRIDPPGVLTYPRGFDIIGNGVDIAEPFVAGFMETAPVWGALPLHKAAQVLVKAKTEAEKRNPGVGMSGRMVYVSEGRYRELDRPDTVVLESSLKCLEHGLLSQADTDELFTIATTKDKPFDRMLAFLDGRVDKNLLFRHFFTNGHE
ncbi:MAG: hypothetical protein HY515_01575 [Candidatus Aenigmarchaeota archaeon]|nr:hypothetical protein [Candidatus Aenigmarchaeota archaeon]